MNLWQKIEERGREEFMIGESWHLYAVDLDKDNYGLAEVKLAQKDPQGRYKSDHSVIGHVKYFDLI